MSSPSPTLEVRNTGRARRIESSGAEHHAAAAPLPPGRVAAAAAASSRIHVPSAVFSPPVRGVDTLTPFPRHPVLSFPTAAAMTFGGNGGDDEGITCVPAAAAIARAESAATKPRKLPECTNREERPGCTTEREGGGAAAADMSSPA